MKLWENVSLLINLKKINDAWHWHIPPRKWFYFNVLSKIKSVPIPQMFPCSPKYVSGTRERNSVPQTHLGNKVTKFCSPNVFGEQGNEIMFPKWYLGNWGTRFCSPNDVWRTGERDSVPQIIFGELGNEILFPKYVWGTRERNLLVPQMFPKFGEHVTECYR